MTEFNNEEVEEVKSEPVIGEFKPKRKFLNFVSAVNGARIRFIRDVAFVKGEKLSGVLEGAVFKITICDEGTINIEEQEGTNLSDKSMIQRLLNEIDEKDVTGYAQKFVVSGLEFNDINGDRCYLEVEHQKPIDKLKSLFDEEESKPELSDRGFSILDALFSSETDEELYREFEGESDEEIAEEKTVEVPVQEEKKGALSYMEEQFRKMNEAKIMELEYRIDETKKEIIRYGNEASQAEKKKEEKVEALGVLETRLETMKPADEPNGYVFFVSEEQKDMESLDESEIKVATKIADIMKLKTDVLIKMLTDGYYKIKIAKKDDINNQDFELEREVYQKIMTLDVNGKMKMTDEGFEYRGKLNWHQLVSKMIRNGFEQDEEFDKLCNSNSYESKWGGESDEESEVYTVDMSDYQNSISDMGKNLGMGNVAFDEDEIEFSCVEREEEFYAETLTTFNEETDLVFIGTETDGHLIMITDDYSTMGVYINGEPVEGYECDGRFTAMTLSDYKKWYAGIKDDVSDGIEGFVVTNFKGDIQVGARIPYPTEYARGFNTGDYIQHQVEDCEVFVNLPKGTTIYKLNDDLSLPTNVIRDSKIDTVLENKSNC